MMTLPTASEVTRKYLYGSYVVPGDFSADEIIRGNITSTIFVDISEYMAIGAGRFALGAAFEIVTRFFDPGLTDPSVYFLGVPPEQNVVRFTKAELAELFSMESYGLSVDQKMVSDGIDDYAERTYIWNNTAFQLGDSVEFVAIRDNDGNYTLSIENYSVEPRLINVNGVVIPENFDMVAGDGLTGIANELLQQAIDPSGIGRRVDLTFTGTVPAMTAPYTYTDYLAEKQVVAGWGNPILTLSGEMDDLFGNLFAAGVTATIEDGRAVIYGTLGDDVFAGTVTPKGYDISDPTTLSIDFYLWNYIN